MQSDRFQAEVAAVLLLLLLLLHVSEQVLFLFLLTESEPKVHSQSRGNLSARPAWTPRTAAIKGSGSAAATAATVCDVVG